MKYLSAFIELFRFLRRRRERLAAEKAAEREHTLELVDRVLKSAEVQAELFAKTQIAQAEANTRQAEALGKWFEMFKVNNEAAQQTTSSVRPEDEHDEWQQREIKRLVEAGYPVEGSPEEQLAYLISMGEA